MGYCNKLLIVFALLGIVCVILGAVLGFAVLPDMVRNEVEEQVRLEDNTIQFERWEEMPFPLTFKIYLFNVENPDAILLGAKPEVKQKGPYVYKQFRRKEDIVRNDVDDTLSYYQYQNFEFDAEASHPLLENDTIVMLNAPLYGMFLTVEMLGDLLLESANNQWEDAFPGSGLFPEITVKDYLFNGYTFCEDSDIPICSILATELVHQIRPMELQDDGSILFSFFRFKDDEHNGRHTIIAGMDIVEDLGLITEWENTTQLDTWNYTISETCNEIRGRDSTLFPPHVEQADTFDIYNTDICRVVTLEYVRDEEYEGITGQRRQLTEDTLSNDGDNKCFCTEFSRGLDGNRNCFPNGFIDLYSCFGASVILSFPHFLWADEEYSNTVDGLLPIEEEHVTFVTLEPGTGTPLRGASRIQFNMVTRPIDRIDVTSDLLPAMFPLVWIEESMELPEDLVEDLRTRYLDRLVMIEVVTWVLIGVGLAVFIGCSGVYLYRR